MTRDHIRLLFASMSSAAAVTLVAFLGNPQLTRDVKRPDDAVQLAVWLSEHPADWVAAATLADRSLDTTIPHRVAVWRGAADLSKRLAPGRTNGDVGFVRAGLFHWPELAPADRASVLAKAAPLLREDERVFQAMVQPLWRLTHDLGWLRKASPGTLNATATLLDLAATNGRFADYRELRTEVAEKRVEAFLQRRATATTSDLVALLPRRLDTGELPLVQALLQEIEARPFEHEQLRARADDLALFAIDHRVQPLSALAPLLSMPGSIAEPTRIRLSHALNGSEAPRFRPAGTGEWQGTCGTAELCSFTFRTLTGPARITATVVQTDEIPPYLELYVNDALAAEGEVLDARTFEIATEGEHRVEVRLANPRTRNGIQRRVRLS
jgi:hypothetical protein